MSPIPYAAQRLAVLMAVHEAGLRDVEADDVLVGDQATFAIVLRRGVRLGDLDGLSRRFATNQMDWGSGDAEHTVVPERDVVLVVRNYRLS